MFFFYIINDRHSLDKLTIRFPDKLSPSVIIRCTADKECDLISVLILLFITEHLTGTALISNVFPFAVKDKIQTAVFDLSPRLDIIKCIGSRYSAELRSVSSRKRCLFYWDIQIIEIWRECRIKCLCSFDNDLPGVGHDHYDRYCRCNSRHRCEPGLLRLSLLS